MDVVDRLIGPRDPRLAKTQRLPVPVDPRRAATRRLGAVNPAEETTRMLPLRKLSALKIKPRMSPKMLAGLAGAAGLGGGAGAGAYHLATREPEPQLRATMSPGEVDEAVRAGGDDFYEDFDTDLGNEDRARLNALLENRRGGIFGGLLDDVTNPFDENIAGGLESIRQQLSERQGGDLGLGQRWRLADPSTRALITAAALAGLGGGAYALTRGGGRERRREQAPAPMPAAPSPMLGMGGMGGFGMGGGGQPPIMIRYG